MLVEEEVLVVGMAEVMRMLFDIIELGCRRLIFFLSRVIRLMEDPELEMLEKGLWCLRRLRIMEANERELRR